MDPKFRSLKSASDLSLLNGLAFEEYLRQLFEQLGYEVEKTPASGDFGGDLVMTKDGKKTVVQAKQYSGQVGFDAIKEVHFAKTYYKADTAAVITTSDFTPRAISAAAAAGIALVDGMRLTSLIARAFENSYHRPKPEIGPAGRSRARGFEFDRGEGDGASVVLRQYHGRSAIIVIPEGVTEIGDHALSIPPKSSPLTKPYCDVKKINEVKLPEGLLKIGEGALACCRNLVFIDIPESVRFIGKGAFAYSGLIGAHIRPEIEYAEGVYRGCESLAEATVYQGVSTLPNQLFSSCKYLSSVSLPSSLKSIGKEAFAFCRTLSSIIIPEGVEEICCRAFSHCSALSKVSLPHSLKRLAIDAFEGCAFLGEGTPAELFDLSGVEVYYRDGTILPEERVTVAYQQKAFFAKNHEALFALDRCWRENEEQKDILREIESIEKELSEIDVDVHRERAELSKGKEEEREKAAREIAEIKKKISHLSAIRYFQRRTLLDSIVDLKLKSESAIKTIEEKHIETIQQLEAHRVQLIEKKKDLNRRIEESRNLVKHTQRKHRLPEKWITAGRTIPESMISDLRMSYVMSREMKKIGL